MSSLALHFDGPYTLTPGAQSLFTALGADVAGVYLWTLPSADGRLCVHYVGETKHFASRHREHLVRILGLDYGLPDLDAARQGRLAWRWPGLWRLKTPDAPAMALACYEALAAEALRYAETLRIFVAPLDGGRALRCHVEGLLARHVRAAPGGAASLYPPDNRTLPGRTSYDLHIDVTAAAPIAGLAMSLEA